VAVAVDVAVAVAVAVGWVERSETHHIAPAHRPDCWFIGFIGFIGLLVLGRVWL